MRLLLPQQGCLNNFNSWMQFYADYLVKVLHFRRVNNASDVPVKSCKYLASRPLRSHNFLHLCGWIFFPLANTLWYLSHYC